MTLEGTCAPNNIGALLISSVLEEHGVSPKDVHFVTVNFPLMGPDLKKHVIAVAWLPEPAMEALPQPYTVPPQIAAVMSLEDYPLSIAPDIDRSRVQRVADAMYEFQMLAHPFQASSMLG